MEEVERRERTFIIDYHCFRCPHVYSWGQGAKSHPRIVKAFTVGEAVLIAEADPYIKRENILGIREQGGI